MSDSDRDPDQNATQFLVYVTTDIPESTPILPLLGVSAEDREDGEDVAFDIQRLHQSLTAQEICQHHQHHIQPGGEINSRLFLIVDRTPLEERGLLLVNLKAYHGYADALRMPPDEAGDAIQSLSIEHTDWYACRESATKAYKTDLVPGDRFALYNLLPNSHDHDEVFETALKAMNDGVGELGTRGGSPKQLPIGLARKYHRGVRPWPDARNLGEVVARHREYAEKEGLDAEMFAVVDERYEGEGPLIVRVTPTPDEFRCRVPTAGEMLGWMFIGFMTWEEAKEWSQ